MCISCEGGANRKSSDNDGRSLCICQHETGCKASWVPDTPSGRDAQWRSNQHKAVRLGGHEVFKGVCGQVLSRLCLRRQCPLRRNPMRKVLPGWLPCRWPQVRNAFAQAPCRVEQSSRRTVVESSRQVRLCVRDVPCPLQVFLVQLL